MLQLLISVDIGAVVRMFDTLSLLDEGAYCGSDDLAAQVCQHELLHRVVAMTLYIIYTSLSSQERF